MNQENRIPVAVLGATGMVGQRFINGLRDHPFFEVVAVAASPKSAGMQYKDAVKGRWHMSRKIPASVGRMEVLRVEDDLPAILDRARVVFSALDLDKERIRQIEDAYAAGGAAVVSNNSAHRWTPDVPMMIPEVNSQHTDVIVFQRKKRGWRKGMIAVKPNCSIQSFVPALDALKSFGIGKVSVVTSQALSGAGWTFKTKPGMIDNVDPYIPGEEEKTRKEPLKIWGEVQNGEIVSAGVPDISARCTRVPVADGHMAFVTVSFDKTPKKSDVIAAFDDYNRHVITRELGLPSAPDEFIVFHDAVDRPQPKLDRMAGRGMSISVGGLQETEDELHFVGLSHNTIRGAAGGAILTAELLQAKGYI